MNSQPTTAQIWEAIDKELFAVLGMVTAGNEARTAGIVYVTRDRRLYIVSRKDAWKVRHVANNPHVSITIPVHKGIPFLPWIKIPAATITFCGTARIQDPEEIPPELLRALVRGMVDDGELLADSCLIEVTPIKEFVTCGIGVSLMKMRDPKQARGRAPVGVQEPVLQQRQ